MSATVHDMFYWNQGYESARQHQAERSDRDRLQDFLREVVGLDEIEWQPSQVETAIAIRQDGEANKIVFVFDTEGKFVRFGTAPNEEMKR